MKLRRFCLLVFPLLILPFLAGSAYADTLGTNLSPFAVLGATTVTNAGVLVLGQTVITGDLGVSPGTAVTGFLDTPFNTYSGLGSNLPLGPGLVTGTIHLADTAAANARLGLFAAITALGPYGQLGSTSILAGGLSNNSLTPGVYSVVHSAFDLAAGSKLTLTGTGMFVFLMQTSLITGAGTTVDISGLGAGSSVYWVPTTSTTLGDNSAFAGNILGQTLIAFNPGATDLCGRALSSTGAVTFAGQNATTKIQNQVSIGCSGVLSTSNGLNGATLPEPSSMILLGTGLLGLAGTARRKLKR